jgi:hypothetical protein
VVKSRTNLPYNNAVLEKNLGGQSTLYGANTIKILAAKSAISKFCSGGLVLSLIVY